MIVTNPDPSQLILQATTEQSDGSVKTDITTATVRVFYVDSGDVEQEVLTSTALVQVASTNVWRYRWAPTSLAAGEYHAEYYFVDDFGKVARRIEPLTVVDFAGWDLAFADHTDAGSFGWVLSKLLRAWIVGNARQVGNQWIVDDPDNPGTAEITFNTFGIGGSPANVAIYKREKV